MMLFICFVDISSVAWIVFLCWFLLDVLSFLVNFENILLVFILPVWSYFTILQLTLIDKVHWTEIPQLKVQLV